jgi:predicted TIM-barrel fold metal-dependent hydrolase
MVIDIHAHVVAPPSLYSYKANLLADGGFHIPSGSGVTDVELADSAGHNVELLDQVGTDLQILSPRPFQQMHSVEPTRLLLPWLRENNEIIARTVALHPNRFAGMAGLPIGPGMQVSEALPELRRCVNDLGFVGVTLNPDPTEGKGHPPTLNDEYWFPLYEELVELDVPALIHSGGCYSGRESYSEHFITEESIAILSLLRSDVLDRYPTLKLIISHGGGSVPYQIGRWQAERRHPGFGRPGSEDFATSLRRLFFDTVLHNQTALELLFRNVGTENCMFGTERPGSGSAPNPDTGRDYDDLKPVIESIGWLTSKDREGIFEENARSCFSRLKI